MVVEKALGFLYAVSNNLFIDLVRSKKVALKFEKSVAPAVEQNDPYFELRTKEFQEQIEKVISELPEGQREAFLLNRIDKLTYKEISEQLGISQTAVEKRIAKALVKMKDAIQELKQQKF